MIDEKSLKEQDYFIGKLDGRQCPDIKAFLKEIGTSFNFPSYYGKNMNALWECINDLDWIEENNYALVITSYKEFLKKEDEVTKKGIMNSLLKVREEWSNVPNYEGEDEFRSKADFIIDLNE